MSKGKSPETRRRDGLRPQGPEAPGVPYVLSLPNHRSVFVQLPARMVCKDRGGEMAFTPEGMEYLDRIHALAMTPPKNPSPAYLATLRKALGLTQKELGRRLGCSPLTISRWERGTMRPSPTSLRKLYALADKLKGRGIDLGMTG